MEEDIMFVTIIDNRVFVKLSRRNLRQLDAILEDSDVCKRCLVREDENGMSLYLQVDDDEEHYEGRDPGPGLGGVA